MILIVPELTIHAHEGIKRVQLRLVVRPVLLLAAERIRGEVDTVALRARDLRAKVVDGEVVAPDLDGRKALARCVMDDSTRLRTSQ